MNKNEKSKIISEVRVLIDGATALYLTNFSGISVSEITNLRNELRKEGVTYKVIKNTLFERALKESEKYEKLADYLTGMTGYIFTSSNPVAPAKVIKKYFETSKKFELKACYIEGQFYDGSRLSELATLPSKEEIVAGILGSLNSPASGIVGAINAVFRDLVNVVDQISKREAA